MLLLARPAAAQIGMQVASLWESVLIPVHDVRRPASSSCAIRREAVQVIGTMYIGELWK